MRPRVRRRADRWRRPDGDQVDRLPEVGVPGLRIDLHTHSTASDGVLTPARLVWAARERGVGTLALTDHDTTDGVPEALEAGRTARVDVISGVEINTDVGPYEVHILGYFIDPSQDALQALLRRMRSERIERARMMVDKLAALGVHVEWARIQSIAAGAPIGRPHIARALAASGRVTSPQEAFERYLGRSAPAYVPRGTLLPEEAIEVIRRASGVPVLAHPGWEAGGPIIERLPLLVEHGLCGIEVYYPDHTPGMVSAFRAAARRWGLVETGGTDYHGGGIATRVALGGVPIPPEVVPALRARWKALRAASATAAASPPGVIAPALRSGSARRLRCGQPCNPSRRPEVG